MALPSNVNRSGDISRSDLRRTLRSALAGAPDRLITGCLNYATGARKQRQYRWPKEKAKRNAIAARKWAHEIGELIASLRSELDPSTTTSPTLVHGTVLEHLVSWVRGSPSDIDDLRKALSEVEAFCRQVSRRRSGRPKDRDDETLAFNLETLFRVHDQPIRDDHEKVTPALVAAFQSIKWDRAGREPTSESVTKYLTRRPAVNIIDWLRQNGIKKRPASV